MHIKMHVMRVHLYKSSRFFFSFHIPHALLVTMMARKKTELEDKRFIT